MKVRPLFPLAMAATLAACGAPQSPPPETATTTTTTTTTTKVVETKGADTARIATTKTTTTVKGAAPAALAPPAQATNQAGLRGSRVSASRGKEGGVLVLWPRIIPADSTPAIAAVATTLQSKLREMALAALPGRDLDFRPAPERVCPMAGCKAVSVGVLLSHQQGGCAAVALVSRPGQSPATLVPWIGKLTLKVNEAAFRSPPESLVTVNDFATCAELLQNTTEAEKLIKSAIKAAAQQK